MGKKSFLITNYISRFNSLTCTFTWHVGYKKQENHCKSTFLTHWCSSQRVKYSGFFGKYCLKLVKSKDCKIKQGGSKRFQKRHYRHHKCLNIANLVNTRVSEIIKYQPHGGWNHLLSVKNIKIEKVGGACHIKPF